MNEPSVVLVDINPGMVRAWRDSFQANPEVTIVRGSMLQQTVDAWVSPTNSRGSMDGGLDKVIKDHLGASIEQSLQRRIEQQHDGRLPLGWAVCTATGLDQPSYLISTPTMTQSSEDVSQTMNVAMACAAAFAAVRLLNDEQPGAIRSLALPGLGANTGKVPVEVCADMMWTAYTLFREGRIQGFASLRYTLAQHLGELEPMSDELPSGINSGGSGAASGNGHDSTGKPSGPGKPAKPDPQPAPEDFDDFD